MGSIIGAGQGQVLTYIRILSNFKCINTQIISSSSFFSYHSL